MAFSYNKFWKLLIDKKMMKKDLMAKTKFDIDNDGEDEQGLASKHGCVSQNL